jgi:hypothetical protein
VYEKKASRYKFIEQLLENPKEYFVLTFDYTCRDNDDEISFAYCIPYTLSDLLRFLRSKQ